MDIDNVSSEVRMEEIEVAHMRVDFNKITDFASLKAAVKLLNKRDTMFHKFLISTAQEKCENFGRGRGCNSFGGSRFGRGRDSQTRNRVFGVREEKSQMVEKQDERRIETLEDEGEWLEFPKGDVNIFNY